MSGRASGSALAPCGAEVVVRGRDRRRRRSRPRDRLLPRRGATASPTSRCSSAAGSPAGTSRATRRSSARTTSGTRARRSTSTRCKLWEGLEAELDYDLLFSQRGVLNLAHTLQDVRDGVRRVQREPAQRRRRRVARAGRGRRGLPDPRTSRPTCATRCSARPTSRAAGSRGTRTSRGATRAPPTRSGVDLDPGLRGDRHRRERRPRGRVETTPRPDRGRHASRSSPPATRSVLAEHGRRPAAAPDPPAAGARLGAVRAGAPTRRDVERGARLRQPGAQGRARDGRRHRRLQLATPSAARST